MQQKLLSSYSVFTPNQLQYYSFHTRISLTHHKLSSHTYSWAQIDSQVNKREQGYKCDDCITHWKKPPLPLRNHPPLSLSCWPLISVTMSTKFMQLSNWYVRQYSTVSNKVIHSKETNIIFKMTMFCDEEETNTFEVLNEWNERKS